MLLACFAGIYEVLSDSLGHQFGPDSAQVEDIMKQIDSIIERLLDQLQSTDMEDGSGKLGEHVNVILVSDHGMEKHNPADHVDLTTIMDPEWIDRYMFNQIWPAEGKLEQVSIIHITFSKYYQQWYFE